MPALDSSLRSSLDKAVVQARDQAETAARSALVALAVDRGEPFATLSPQQRQLRRALRARARQLGDDKQTAGFEPLVEEVAYEQWHRMLFARFLAENGLLMHPGGAAVTLDECEQLAAEEGEPDKWQLAARYASRMLPGIFRPDDPATQVRFAPEGRAALEGILASLAPAVFTSDDGLGWVYQFWQTKKKREVNQSGRKIGGADLFPVTQLFTEDYMVRFLLENSLGAWWAGRHPDSPLLKDWAYLRFADDCAPAAGTFPGWPARVADVTVMDPCCGSGHFLVAAFDMLRRMRMEEEGLSEREAADAVLRDNLFGLEIDPRCVQIAAFAVALAAWKAGGYRPLPSLSIACSGIPVTGQLEEWTKLAGDDVNLKFTLERLYHLFRDAPDLGSLINPADVPLRDRMFAPDFATVAPVLERALARERASDPVAALFGEAAVGVARAADLLARRYMLVTTNVPYLARGKQGDVLKLHLERQHAPAKADLAAAFVDRCRAFSVSNGTYALVTPQNWLFLGSYRVMRQALLNEQLWYLVTKLGPGAFETISGEVVSVALILLGNCWPSAGHRLIGLDASAPRTAAEKGRILREAQVQFMEQVGQVQNVDCRVVFGTRQEQQLLQEVAISYLGLGTGDGPKYLRLFWEFDRLCTGWAFCQSAVQSTKQYGGREQVISWDRRIGRVRGMSDAEREQVHGQDRSGAPAWGRPGVAVALMRRLPATLYDGAIFDKSMAVILAKVAEHIPAIWSYCSSPQFHDDVRKLDQKVIVANGTLAKVPFDLKHWTKVAEEKFPQGLPEPYSNDPTQWLFKGCTIDSTEPLQVSVARLLGYHWPQQERDQLSPLADTDDLVPLVAIAGEEPAAERLRRVLATAYGEQWSPARQEQLLQQAGFGGKTLDVWLREGFFEQHTKLFQQRPFIWHIWDGRKDGFSVLVNYHTLDGPKLDRLIYTYLGAWIATQQAERDSGIAGADGRLVAALELQNKLKLIREGEPPYDIYVRWKPLHQQPIGWEPDINDGVRLNIRPFVTAGVLRARVNVKWTKDRGTNPDGSERINDRHFTNAEKLAARTAAGV